MTHNIVFLEHFRMKNLRVTLNYIIEAQHGWILECPIPTAKYIQLQFYKDIFHLDSFINLEQFSIWNNFFMESFNPWRKENKEAETICFEVTILRKTTES